MHKNRSKFSHPEFSLGCLSVLKASLQCAPCSLVFKMVSDQKKLGADLVGWKIYLSQKSEIVSLIFLTHASSHHGFPMEWRCWVTQREDCPCNVSWAIGNWQCPCSLENFFLPSFEDILQGLESWQTGQHFSSTQLFTEQSRVFWVPSC
jgi:hypothetical protein